MSSLPPESAPARVSPNAAPLFTLQFPADALFAAPLAGLVGELATRHGLGETRTGQLALAAEEVVAYLAPLLAGLPINASLTTTATGLALHFAFPDQRTDLHHFNLTTDRAEYLAADGDSSGLGLYLAARVVDDFGLELASGRAAITLRHDRPFPTIAPLAPPAAFSGPLTLAPLATADLIDTACAQIIAAYTPEDYEAVVTTPARLAALIAGGSHDALVATDAAGRVGGLLYWTVPSAKSALFFGPYVFGVRGPEAAQLLCEGLLARLGKTSVQSVFAGHATAQTPTALFERILFPGPQPRPLLFRQIHEEAGAVVRCPPAFREMLQRIYNDLFLIRDLMPAPSPESLPPGRSVLGADFDRARSRATLRPLVAGADLAANIAAHVAFLHREGIRHVRARCDLHHGWHAAAAGLFGAAGFVPVGLEPGAGLGDILILEHHG